MEEENFKNNFVEKIDDFLRNRMEIYDKFRLRDTKEFLTTDEVYQRYKDLVQEKENRSIRIPNYKDSVQIGKMVVFTKEEKERVFAVIKDYLTKTYIVHYPNSRFESSFLTDILEIIIANKDVSIELKSELERYLVSLHCIHDFLSFEYDYFAFVCNNSGHFYIQDHTGKEFINYNAMNPFENSISDFTPLIMNDSLKLISLKGKEEERNEIFFGTYDNEGYHIFKTGEVLDDSDYNLDFSFPISEFLDMKGCSFLKKEIYDPGDLINISQSIKRFENMSDEEKGNISMLAYIAAKFILERYERAHFCNNDIQASNLASGYMSREQVYELGQKENLFIKALADEIQAKLLKDGFIRLSLEHTSVGVIRRVINKAALYFRPVFEELEVDLDKIVFGDFYHNKEVIYSKYNDFNNQPQLKK